MATGVGTFTDARKLRPSRWQQRFQYGTELPTPASKSPEEEMAEAQKLLELLQAPQTKEEAKKTIQHLVECSLKLGPRRTDDLLSNGLAQKVRGFSEGLMIISADQHQEHSTNRHISDTNNAGKPDADDISRAEHCVLAMYNFSVALMNGVLEGQTYKTLVNHLCDNKAGADLVATAGSSKAAVQWVAHTMDNLTNLLLLRSEPLQRLVGWLMPMVSACTPGTWKVIAQVMLCTAQPHMNLDIRRRNVAEVAEAFATALQQQAAAPTAAGSSAIPAAAIKAALLLNCSSFRTACVGWLGQWQGGSSSSSSSSRDEFLNRSAVDAVRAAASAAEQCAGLCEQQPSLQQGLRSFVDSRLAKGILLGIAWLGKEAPAMNQDPQPGISAINKLWMRARRISQQQVDASIKQHLEEAPQQLLLPLLHAVNGAAACSATGAQDACLLLCLLARGLASNAVVPEPSMQDFQQWVRAGEILPQLPADSADAVQARADLAGVLAQLVQQRSALNALPRDAHCRTAGGAIVCLILLQHFLAAGASSSSSESWQSTMIADLQRSQLHQLHLLWPHVVAGHGEHWSTRLVVGVMDAARGRAKGEQQQQLTRLFSDWMSDLAAVGAGLVTGTAGGSSCVTTTSSSSNGDLKVLRGTLAVVQGLVRGSGVVVPWGVSEVRRLRLEELQQQLAAAVAGGSGEICQDLLDQVSNMCQDLLDLAQQQQQQQQQPKKKKSKKKRKKGQGGGPAAAEAAGSSSTAAVGVASSSAAGAAGTDAAPASNSSTADVASSAAGAAGSSTAAATSSGTAAAAAAAATTTTASSSTRRRRRRKVIVRSRPGTSCACCGASRDDVGLFKVCGGCDRVRYCNVQCQKHHWRLHKPHCGK